MTKHLLSLKSILVVLIITGLLSACSKKEVTPSNKLVGTWTISSATYEATVNGKSFTQYLQDEGFSQDQIDLYTQLFDASTQQSFTGTVTVNADNTYTANISGSNESGTWSLNSAGDKLTLSPSGDVPTTFDIIKLDSNNLELSFTADEQDDLNGDGTSETITLSVDMKLTK